MIISPDSDIHASLVDFFLDTLLLIVSIGRILAELEPFSAFFSLFMIRRRFSITHIVLVIRVFQLA